MILHLAVDPITLSLLGLGLGIGGGAASLLSKSSTPSVPTMPPAAPPVQSPTGTQTSNAPANQPSFLAAAAAPQGNQAAGTKSLLGQ
jgi:hypothetical protein